MEDFINEFRREKSGFLKDFDEKYFTSFDIQKGLLAQLREFYAEEYPRLCDVTLICNDKKPVRGHKLLLSFVSGFFKALFKQEPDKTEYEINYCDSEIMQWIVKAVCSASIESVPINDLNLGEILKALDYFQMPDALQDVSRRFRKDIFESKQNIIEILRMAEVINIPSKKHCIDHISKRLEIWHKERKLEELPLTTLKEIFKGDPMQRYVLLRSRVVIDHMTLVKRSLIIIYEVLKSKDSLDCFQEIVTENMRLHSEMDFLYFFATGDTSSFFTEFEYRDAVTNDDLQWNAHGPCHHKYLPKIDDFILDPKSDLCQRLLAFAKRPEIPFMWAGTFAYWANLKTNETAEEIDEWSIDCNKPILKIIVRFVGPNLPDFNGLAVIEGITVFFKDKTSQSINMDQNVHGNDKVFEMKVLDSIHNIDVLAEEDDALVNIRLIIKQFIREQQDYVLESIELESNPEEEVLQPTYVPKQNAMDEYCGCRGSIIGIKGQFTQRNGRKVLSNLSFKIEFFTSQWWDDYNLAHVLLDGYWPLD